MADERYAIGVDLGGTFIKAGVVDADANIIEKVSIDTEVEKGLDAVVANIARAAQQALDAAGLGWDDVVGLGLGTPGIVDFENGVLLFAPNLACLNETKLAHLVKAELKRNVGVYLENDANAAALGEKWAADGDVHSLVLMTLGTGIGGGIILNDAIWHGARGIGAELGHQTIFPTGEYICGCGNRGCLEAYASAPGTVRRFLAAAKRGRETSLAGRLNEVTCKDIHEAAVAGDALAKDILTETGKILGIAVTNILNILDPQMIVFAGGMTAAGDLLLKPIIAEAERRMYGPKLEGVTVSFGKLGNDAGLIGAAGCAFNRFGTSA